jgi:hypothetical protein
MEVLGGIYIERPKWCGKSTTLGRLAKKIIKTTEKRLAKPTI